MSNIWPTNFDPDGIENTLHFSRRDKNENNPLERTDTPDVSHMESMMTLSGGIL